MNGLTKYKEDAFTLENFISSEEAKKVISYLEFLVNNNILQWNQISFYESYAMGFWKEDPNLLLFGLEADYFEKLKIKIKKTAEEVLGIELSEVSYHAQKWTEGAFASFHSDNTDENGNPTAFERSKYAVFLYLNDNFSGGFLNFKNYDIHIKPKTGLLAMFSGTFGNEHEVTMVKSGVRYTIGSFWDKADSVYTQEQRDAWDLELKTVRAEQEILYKQWAKDRELGKFPEYRGKID